MASNGVSASVILNSAFFKTLNYFIMAKTWFVIIKPFGVRIWILMMLYFWTRLRVSFNAYISILVAIQVIYRALTRQLTTG
jgi:hypothetical protein